MHVLTNSEMGERRNGLRFCYTAGSKNEQVQHRSKQQQQQQRQQEQQQSRA